MMQAKKLHFQIECSVCATVLHYPQDAVCKVCGCVAVAWTSTPEASSLEKFERINKIKKENDIAGKLLKGNIGHVNNNINKLTAAQASLKTRITGLRGSLHTMQEQKHQLGNNPNHEVDLSGFQKSVSDIQNAIVDLTSKYSEIPEQKARPVTLKCTYQDDTNSIKVVVTEMQRYAPSTLELFVGLALSRQPIYGSEDIDIVIPVKNRKEPVRIEVGKEFNLELEQIPNKTFIHSGIVHLYADSVSKFVIE